MIPGSLMEPLHDIRVTGGAEEETEGFGQRHLVKGKNQRKLFLMTAFSNANSKRIL